MARDGSKTESNEVGERVRELRRGRSLTLRELSQRSGVSTDALVKLEHGARPSRPTTIRKVAEALGVDPAYLLEGSPGVVLGAPAGARQETMALTSLWAEERGVSEDEAERQIKLRSEQLERVRDGRRTLGLPRGQRIITASGRMDAGSAAVSAVRGE